MCTSIVEIVNAEGKGKDGNAWFKLNQAVVCYDHPHHALLALGVASFLNLRGETGTGHAPQLLAHGPQLLLR